MHAFDPATARTEIAIAVVTRDGCLLIGKRPEGTTLEGYWEFPGGKVSPGESAAEAAARECLEETGLKVEVGAAYPPVDYDYPHARLRLSFFACTAVEQQRELPERFRWVPAVELAEYQFPPANDALVKLLVDSAQRHA